MKHKSLVLLCFPIVVLSLWGESQQRVQYVTNSSTGASRELEAVRAGMSKFYPPTNSIRLINVKSFPTVVDAEAENYLWIPSNMTNDSKWNIYITDEKANAVFVFDLEGLFLRRFGRSGQGPGDLLKPTRIKFVKNNLAVQEINNRRIQFFDTLGNSMKITHIYKNCFSHDIKDDGQIVAVSLLSRGNRIGDRLINIFTPEGRLTQSFGDPLPYEDPNLSTAFVFDDKDRIIVCFNRFPILRVYSYSGDLISEVNYSDGSIELKKKWNEKTNATRGYFSMMRAAKMHNGFLYLYNSWENPNYFWITKIDMNGNIIKYYWSDIEEDFLSLDFLIREGGKTGIEFYILQRSPEGKVRVFAPKQ